MNLVGWTSRGVQSFGPRDAHFLIHSPPSATPHLWVAGLHHQIQSPKTQPAQLAEASLPLSTNSTPIPEVTTTHTIAF